MNFDQMKTNAKELTLTSIKPDEKIADVTGTAQPTTSNGSTEVFSKVEKKDTTAAGAAGYESKRKLNRSNRQRGGDNLNAITETLPTDVSDSSGSEDNNIPFIATAECTSMHEGRQIVHTILPINVDTLFNILFSKSKFLVDFHVMRKSTDTCFGEWFTNQEGLQERTVNVTVQLAASVGPKTSKVTEHQIMRECSKPGELYSIDVNSVNAGIPYADSFCVLMHFCLVRTVDNNTMFSVHVQIQYKKSVWGVMKSIIEKNTWAGLEDFYNALLHQLQSETNIPPAKGKGRRPRRGTVAQVRPADEVPVEKKETEIVEHENNINLYSPHVPTTPPAVSNDFKSKNKWIAFFLISILSFLIAVNVILVLKMWSLEQRIDEDITYRSRMPSMLSMRSIPNNAKEWMSLMRQQSELHEVELRKWHRILQAAIELLRKTEKTLTEILFHS